MNKQYTAAERAAQVPQVVYDARPEFVALYRKAWELAARHVKRIPGMPCPVYMDEAFCHTNIWIWDTCFMAMFCKYAPDIFPGVESLQNFYGVMYGNAEYPFVTVPSGEPKWATGGAPEGSSIRLRLHIADNPPLFAWAEHQNALFTGDTAHLRKLLLEDKYLQKHYEWLENLKKTFTAPWLVCPTRWIAHETGYSWEGGRSGMDNSPRGRNGDRSEAFRPATSDLLWLDALAQQGLAAECIGGMFDMIGEPEAAAEWRDRAKRKAKLLHDRYWDAADRMFYDRSQTMNDFCKVPTIASFWPLASGAADAEQARCMAEKLADPEYFGGTVPFVSLARRDGDFHAVGGAYWRGSVWVPTAYAAARGLLRYGHFDLARRQTTELLNAMCRVCDTCEPHSIWECYSPDGTAPGRQICNDVLCRKDFCGWSALAPISMLIECVIGIHTVDAFRKLVRWDLDTAAPGKTGIRNLRFGGITTSLIFADGKVEVESSAPFTLEINGREFPVETGKRQISLRETTN
jgi:hypothetical protein